MNRLEEIYACVLVREFPAQAMLRLRPELRRRACVVMAGEPPMQQVCAINNLARANGIEHGMTQVEIDTFPDVAVLSRSLEEEAAARAALLECAGNFSPRVEDCSEDGVFACVLDIAGTEKLFGPSESLAHDLLSRIRTLGVSARIAVCGNFHAAVALARGLSGDTLTQVVPAGEENAALASLPLPLLELTEDQRETFSLWGIRTLGMLAALPEKELIARIGQDGKRLRQFARGEMPHLFQPVESVFALQERMELDTPVEVLDALLFVVNLMLEQLIARAGSRALALASVTITLQLEGGTTHTRTVRPALPTNDRPMWIKLLHLDLEAHPPPAAILSMAIKAEPGDTSKVQLGLFSPQFPEALRLDVTLARIHAIVGEEHAGRAVLKDTHSPDGFRLEPFAVASVRPSEMQAVLPHPAMRMLRPAESIAVTLQNQRPSSLIFRARRYAVEHSYGPWKSSGAWWSATLWGREEWDLVARAQDGAILCCCLVRDLLHEEWQMAALYD